MHFLRLAVFGAIVTALVLLAAFDTDSGATTLDDAGNSVNTAREPQIRRQLGPSELDLAERRISILEEENARLTQRALTAEHELTVQMERADRAELNAHRVTAKVDGWTFAMQEAVYWTVFNALAPAADLDYALRVAQCESGGELDPHAAVGPTKDYGRLQINRKSWKATHQLLYPGEQFETHVLRPEVNARMAAYVWNDSGSWGPWACHYIIRGVPVPW